ncbi:hypothetical protein [Stutzerimonas nitrititolerans]|uniref:hypothetical protein n=1 Tax=Stutzerimonas nitrititolerans TaxID=2482751 RepID=UPI0028A129FA|nr:hypothetical protein [Stutzerimonas nitrititolerans]
MNLENHADEEFEKIISSHAQTNLLKKEIKKIETSIACMQNQRHELLNSRTSLTTKSIGVANVLFNVWVMSNGVHKGVDFKNPAKAKIAEDLTKLEVKLAAEKRALEDCKQKLDKLLNIAKAEYSSSITSKSDDKIIATPSDTKKQETKMTSKKRIYVNPKYQKELTEGGLVSQTPTRPTESLDFNPADCSAPEVFPEPQGKRSADDSSLLKDYSVKIERIDEEIQSIEAFKSTATSDAEVALLEQELEAFILRKESLQRSKRKVEKKVHDQQKVVALGIKTICIDGSNLCNQTTPPKYVGLVLLKAIVPELITRYEVVIVFDSNALPKLKETRQSLQKHFAGCTVVVSERGCEADPLLINTANGDPYTFILSNDGFADYRNDPAVKENRVIRFEAFAKNIHIQRLNLSARYEVN